MLKIEKFVTPSPEQWEIVIEGMRNPMNSWDRMDSTNTTGFEEPAIFELGSNDRKLAMQLSENGPVHAKYRRMITVYLDITAPLYWWKEFDTYKVGTVCNSCSTMHKIHAKEFAIEDFSCVHLLHDEDLGSYGAEWLTPFDVLDIIVANLNGARERFLETGDKKYWWQMIQLLPSSYNQKRTVMLNYEVLANIYTWRKNHKLDEWRTFCNWIEELPYSELITGLTSDADDGGGAGDLSEEAIIDKLSETPLTYAVTAEDIHSSSR